MYLFILRHGKAGKSSSETTDAARAFIRDGNDEIKKVALRMKGNNFKFDAIATGSSGSVRIRVARAQLKTVPNLGQSGHFYASPESW